MDTILREILEEVLTSELEQEIAITRLRRLSSEYVRVGGVRDL